MGIMKKIKSKLKDNVFGDEKAKKQGAGGPPETEREKRQRENFKKLHEKK